MLFDTAHVAARPTFNVCVPRDIIPDEEDEPDGSGEQEERSAALSTAYALSLLSEYTQSLDSLPADVSRQFADLRELDAVLSASVHALTSKITRLVEMIETDSSPKEQRMWLLMEIADEAQRLRLGGEDKIRVAAQVADGLKAQNEHMTSLLLHIPGFNPSILARHTVYPHIAPRSSAPLSMYENGRRRRGALLSGTADQNSSSTRGDAVHGTMMQKGQDAAKREDHGCQLAVEERRSFKKSLLSVTSHQQQVHTISAPPAYAAAAATAPARSTNSRKPGQQQTAPPAPRQPLRPDRRRRTARSASSLAGTGGAGELSGTATSGHPSHVSSSYPPAMSAAAAAVGGWSGPVHAQLEGPGMPVARSIVASHPAVLTGPGVDGGGAVAGGGGVAAGASIDTGDGADDGAEADDGRLYCWCQVGSYGDMVACDDNECEREWFHLGCIGLEVAPEGVWFCEACRVKPKNKRKIARAAASGGGNRRSNGNPRSARAPSTTT
ncbi:hypothetical protein EDB83DRAFT_2593093 [Lactarius deliciosus]|nr:hypothetical protein EDB83DRAFT_2593093 [Lactarius deliciosus]